MDFDFHAVMRLERSTIVYQSLANSCLRAPSDWIIPVTMPPPRPGYIAEREELDAALGIGTAEALRLFLDRHPESRYRPEAEAALKKLAAPPPSTR